MPLEWLKSRGWASLSNTSLRLEPSSDISAIGEQAMLH
jgi:hypothetical protein